MWRCVERNQQCWYQDCDLGHIALGLAKTRAHMVAPQGCGVCPCLTPALHAQAEITIVAGYGSTKDVSVYSSLGLAPSHIYIVGRAVKKFHNQCQVWGQGWGRAGAVGSVLCPCPEVSGRPCVPQFLSEGYVAHLAQLEAAALAHSPKGPPRPVLGKGTYGCPAPVDFLRKQSQLLRSRGSSQAERDGGPSPAPPSLPRAKPRSVSLKLEGEE